MKNELTQITNANDKLICEVAHDSSEWYVIIRKGKVQTVITLLADGSNRVVDTHLI